MPFVTTSINACRRLGVIAQCQVGRHCRIASEQRSTEEKCHLAHYSAGMHGHVRWVGLCEGGGGVVLCHF